jgi:hypothetical protein
MGLKCSKCGFEPEDESYLDLHHIIPRWMGGKDIDGRKYLCSAGRGKDCHRQLHTILKEKTKEFTLEWLK